MLDTNLEVRPSVTMFLLLYQQENFVEEAVSSAFNQDYENLRIVLSDDCSSDNTFKIAKKLVDSYSGKHDVVLSRNKENLGIGKHFRYIMDNLVEGELIIAAAGDDISAPKRVSRIVDEWLLAGRPELVAHGLQEIDESGKKLESDRTLQYRLQENPTTKNKLTSITDYIRNPYPLPFLGATLAYSKGLYDKLGPPSLAPDYEDHLMYFRTLVSGRMIFFNDPLVLYRRHTTNFSNHKKIKDVRIVNVPLGTTTLKIRADSLGQYRLHMLACQQFLDLCTAIKGGHFSETFDMDLLFNLISRIRSRHFRLVSKHGSWKQKFNLSTLPEDKILSYIPRIKIVIFGAGGGGRKLLTHLTPEFEVIAFLDNGSSLKGKSIQGIPILTPDKIGLIEKDVGFIIVASTYYFSIIDQLTNLKNFDMKRVVRAPELLINQPKNPGNRPGSLRWLLLSLVLNFVLLATVIFF